LVVGGQETGAVAKPGDPQRAEVALEEQPRLLWREATGSNRPAAYVLQGEVHRAGLGQRRGGPQQRPAACHKRRKGRAMIIHGPSVERAPVNGLELRVA